ncbi:hypothetical protein TNIN_243941, partial [Trichonephila inaurata madagascariensis]
KFFLLNRQLIMSCLPFNNLDEHLARFAATKKNVISNQNTKQIANVDNTLKKHQDVNKTSNKQGTITSFFSQSEASSKQTNPSNNKNINSSLLNDDFFIDDLNDFIIPCSKTVNKKNNFNHNPQQKDCINSEELIDLEECTSVIFSDEEEIIPCSTRKKNNRRLLSDDESENQEAPKLNDDKECIGNKQ